jgi:hypothetical protein
MLRQLQWEAAFGTSCDFASNLALVDGASSEGNATVQLANGRIRMAELHWYEAHGIGRKKMKIKRFLD